jgi:hypothetical protein
MDLNTLLAEIGNARTVLQGAVATLREAEADVQTAQANLKAAEAAFDEAVLEARGAPVQVQPAPQAQGTGTQEPEREPDGHPKGMPRIPMGPLPATSPALRGELSHLQGALDDADDDRPDQVYPTT